MHLGKEGAELWIKVRRHVRTRTVAAMRDQANRLSSPMLIVAAQGRSRSSVSNRRSGILRDRLAVDRYFVAGRRHTTRLHLFGIRGVLMDHDVFQPDRTGGVALRAHVEVARHAGVR